MYFIAKPRIHFLELIHRKKLIVAPTGVGLVGFLLAYMTGNLLFFQ